MAEPQRIVELSHRVGAIAEQKISRIRDINRETRYLALNALIEAARAGQAGRSFSVVANHVKEVAEQITELAGQLNTELTGSIQELLQLGDAMMLRLRDQTGHRLADLALNMIELMDRNLYERSCDVRWWATDTAVVQALASPGLASTAHASERLGVILDSYTVYLDLWIVDTTGRVIANGRPRRYPHVAGTQLGRVAWLHQALATATGADYVTADVQTARLLDGAAVATYATAIRAGGRHDGEVLGVLAIFFDWEPQAQAIVTQVNLRADERDRSRCLLIDAHHRVLAASDGRGILTEHRHDIPTDVTRGYVVNPAGDLIGHALTPGYETYQGLGWRGVVHLATEAAPAAPLRHATDPDRTLATCT